MNQIALRVLITVASILGYAAVMAVLGPQYFWLVGLLYIASVFIVSMALGIRSYRRGSAQAKEVVRGRLLYDIGEKDVNKAMEKDKELNAELGRLNRYFMIYMLSLPILLIGVWLFPLLQQHIVPAVSGALRPSLGGFLATYIGDIALFAAFTAIFSPLYFFTFRPIQFPIIATDVKIYDTGIVINKTMGLRAPIEVHGYRFEPERRFIELKIGNQAYRIYHKDIEEVHEILSKMVKIREKA
nr:MAG: membrane protein [Thermoproteus sp. AZ2]